MKQINWIHIELISDPKKGSKRPKFPITGIITLGDAPDKFAVDYIPLTSFQWYQASKLSPEQENNTSKLFKNITYELYFNVNEEKFYSADEAPDFVKNNAIIINNK